MEKWHRTLSILYAFWIIPSWRPICVRPAQKRRKNCYFRKIGEMMKMMMMMMMMMMMLMYHQPNTFDIFRQLAELAVIKIIIVSSVDPLAMTGGFKYVENYCFTEIQMIDSDSVRMQCSGLD